MFISKFIYIFSINDCKKRFEFLKYVKIDINKFLTYNNSRFLRVFYSIINKLIRLLIKINFDSRR